MKGRTVNAVLVPLVTGLVAVLGFLTPTQATGVSTQPPAGSGISAAQPGDLPTQTMSMNGGWETRVTPDNQVQLVAPDGSVRTVGRGVHAQTDANGNTYFGSWADGLKRYDPSTNQVVTLKKPFEVDPPYSLNAAGTEMLVHIHDDYISDVMHATTTGVAILDVLTGEVKPVYVKHGTYILAFGWRPDGIFVQTFGHNTGHPVFEVLDRHGTLHPLPQNDLPYTPHFPTVSPDQRTLIYEFDAGTAMIDMQSGKITKAEGVATPHFQGSRLLGKVAGKEVEVKIGQ